MHSSHALDDPDAVRAAPRIRSRIVEPVRWFLRRRGWDLRRFTPAGSPEAQLALVVRHLGVRAVLDVGAGTGSFGRLLRRLGYEGEIVSIEPQRESHGKLRRAASRDARWHVMPAVALGEAPRESVELRVASNADSSSLLDMLEAHREALPGIAMHGVERVAMTTLDAILAGEPRLATGPALLKLDTQGTELAILRGARATLARVAAVHIELSLVPLYAGAPLAAEVLADPLLADFDLWCAWPSFVRASDGRTLQVDATLVRRGAGEAAGSRPW